MRIRSLMVMSLVAVLPAGVLAKRGLAKDVTPIIHNGIRYSAPNDNGRVGYVLASDAKTGSELARFVIFRTRIDPILEEDVQWVFITDLKVTGSVMAIKDERSRCYQLDLKTKTVKRRACFLVKFAD